MNEGNQGPLCRIGTAMFGDFPGANPVGTKQSAIRQVIQAEGSAALSGASRRISGSLHSAKRVMKSVLHIDEDKEHDRRLAGVQIDPAVVGAKEKMRVLRNELHEAIELYELFDKSEDAILLRLEDLAGWCRHELFCGDEESAAALSGDVDHLSAVAELGLVLNGDAGRAIEGLRAAERAVLAGLEGLHRHELQFREVSRAHSAAQTRLGKANGALGAAREEQRKATAAQAKAAGAAAAAAIASSLRAIEEAKDAAHRSHDDLAKLESEGVPAALAAAAAARDEAEAAIAAAATELDAAYRTFARGAAAALARWESLGAAPLPWVPPPRRPLPTARDELLLALDARWLYGRERCDAAGKQLETFGSRGIGAAAAPRGEAARLRGLAQAVQSPHVAALLEALAVTTPELEEAEAECEEVLDELRAELSQLGAALEASRAPLRERPKLQKQYADATARIERATGGSFSQRTDRGREKLKADLARDMEQVTALADAFVRNDAEIEAAAAPHSAVAAGLRAVCGATARFSRAYLRYCTCRCVEPVRPRPNMGPGFPMDFRSAVAAFDEPDLDAKPGVAPPSLLGGPCAQLARLIGRCIPEPQI